MKYNKEKTEFLFESDAEKAVLNAVSRPKKAKLSNRIIFSTFIFSITICFIFYTLRTIENKEIKKIVASTMSTEELVKNSLEKLDSSNELNKYSFNYNNKYEIIINKANPIDEDTLNNYTLVDVLDNSISNIKLEKETYNNYLNLKNAITNKGYYINIKSGYRSFNDSKKIYNAYKIEKGIDYANKYVSTPGTSEHNTGMAIDFIISKNKNATTTDYESDEYLYLEKIAYVYGFIIRYPKDKEIITGYEYEPWHIRYVGKDLAKYLNKNDLTLEEYYNLKG